MTRVRYDNDTELDGMRILLERASGNRNAIEDSEADGQRRLVASAQLPIEGTQDEAQWTAIGVKLGAPTDNLFRNATLPPGWKLRPTDHSMWSELLDEKGRTRAKIFYKAAFYDRRANVHLVQRYRVDLDYEAFEASHHHRVTETVGGEVRELFRSAAMPGGHKPWQEREEIDRVQRAECIAWLDENRLGWNDPAKQWEIT